MLPLEDDLPRARLVSAGDEPLDQLPLVPRLRLEGAPEVLLDDFWLLRGTVSQKNLDRVRRRSVTEALTERRVPLAVWREDGDIWLAPLLVLDAASDYTLVVWGTGELARVATVSEADDLWHRYGAGPVSAGGWVVYCRQPPPWAWFDGSAAEELPASGVVELWPGPHRTEIAAGLAEDDEGGLARSVCLRFRMPQQPPAGSVGASSSGAGDFVLPPHEYGGRSFVPTPIRRRAPEATSRSAGIEDRSLGGALRVEVKAGVNALELWTRGGELLRTVVVEATAPLTVPLGSAAPGTYLLHVAQQAPGGTLDVGTLELSVFAESPSLVLTEVLANPLGPEPDSEWVEMANVGRAGVSLAGYRLSNGKDVTLLPNVWLDAGAVGLIVTPEFEAGSGGDVVPSGAARPIVVPKLGGAGLTNAGELVQLLDAEGRVVSEIPALGAAAGVSLARVHVLSPDVPASFRRHGAPGASPGGPNRFD